ncbi:MAG: zf-HC2 domain-containing protein [Verrucomicrobiota bacterium]
MDCKTARERIEERVDGLLAPSAASELEAHLASCPGCAADSARASAVGPLLRSDAVARARAAEPRLDAMWTRVRAGISEGKAPSRASWVRDWFWLPAAVALVLLALLIYPTGSDRPPFNPRHFNVSFEDVESDTAGVALVDKGEDLPRVIWIIEDAKSQT